MTTILADYNLGVMVADSLMSDGDRACSFRKVYRIDGELVGFAGNVDEVVQYLDWLRDGMRGHAPKTPTLTVLRLTASGLLSQQGNRAAIPVESGIDAIGSGGMAAMAAYEALGWADPRRAVQIVCRHDANSRGPVRVYKL